ncbi:MAG: hypothetical protein WEA54_00120 [Actinomycetota bacterium]
MTGPPSDRSGPRFRGSGGDARPRCAVILDAIRSFVVPAPEGHLTGTAGSSSGA